MPFLTLRQFMRHVFVIVFALAAWSGSATAQTTPAQPASGPVDARTPQQRLATEIMRGAMITAAVNPLTSEALDIACILARESVALDPGNVGLWRLALNIATLGEREDLRIEAIDTISRLDPANENIRLQRINLALDRYPTVEERAAAYEKLLDSDNVDRLGPPIASRLALDLALLRQRLGDMDAFTRWLTKALELDRSNRAAAAMAAGFFQANVTDAVGRAELLTNLITADPTDIQTQVSLAQLLLENGAYTAAVRIYQDVRSGMKTARIAASTEFMADVAIAQWAAGDIEAALETIDQRQAEIDEAFRAEKARTDTSLTMVAIGNLKGPVDPTLAMVVAAIHADRRDADAAAAIAAAIQAGEADLKTRADAKPPADASELASQHLHLAWITLWLADDVAKAAEHIAAAEALEPLTESTRQRLDGWQALKKGEHDRAIGLLTPLAEGDSSARLGLALALEAAGREKDAARELLALNTSQPGSMIGIWAAGELTRILGQRLPLSKQATQLEQLIASIPSVFDRYPKDASIALALDITPANPNPQAFEPIPLTIQLTNLTNMPLALDKDGPLRPQILVEPIINTSIPTTGTPKPFVIDLDSRLRLLPRETVSTTVDLRWFEVGDMLNIISTAGGIVRLTLYSNFIASDEGTIVTGLYGLEKAAPLLRLDGVRESDQWMTAALDVIGNPQAEGAADPDRMMVQLALLGNEITLAENNPTVPAEKRALINQAKAALPEAFSRLDPVRQAWALTVMTHSFPVEGVLDIARKSDNRLVRIAYLMAHLKGVEDPMLDAARRGEDVPLQTLADRIVTRAANAKKSAKPATAPGR